ncbi:Rha family transcriptional regulator [Bacillus mycoides]|uniref:Rha family transcriptional regulator n=1 Tax=Bacillus mycoides TaxID=1405 RepID=A0A1S9TD05_BACMY|nr:Rha family transcriptional regulator [Bacillus mycoides]OOR07792.1 Rha family transcriptional regulator [Bacillus mycoides]
MTNNLQVSQKGKHIDSLEVAEMTGKRHDNLLRDIDGYLNVFLTNSNMRALEYFEKATYFDLKGEPRRKYLLTRKGCELVANKMTGEKGIFFTVAYIDRFHEMEKAVQQPALPTTYKEALLQLVEQVEANEQMQAQLIEQAPAVEYHDKVLSIDGFLPVTDIAKQLGYRSPQEITAELIKKKVLYRSRRGSLLHTSKYTYLKEEGYIQYKNSRDGKLQLLISESGKKEFARLLDIVQQ